jgi:hypothetical protein
MIGIAGAALGSSEPSGASIPGSSVDAQSASRNSAFRDDPSSVAVNAPGPGSQPTRWRRASEASMQTQTAKPQFRPSALCVAVYLAGVLAVAAFFIAGGRTSPAAEQMHRFKGMHVAAPPGMHPSFTAECFNMFDYRMPGQSQLHFEVCPYRTVRQVGIDWYSGGPMIYVTGRWTGKWLTEVVNGTMLYAGQLYEGGDGERCPAPLVRQTSVEYRCARNATTPVIVLVSEYAACHYRLIAGVREWCATVDAGLASDPEDAGEGHENKNGPTDGRQRLRALESGAWTFPGRWGVQ